MVAGNRIEGSASFVGGWNGGDYTLYFAAEVGQPFAGYGTFARQNLRNDVPGFAFDETRRRAEQAWAEALGKIRVDGGTDEQLGIFYTALYRSHYMPHDLSGENAWWQSDEPHYEDFYTLWDTFRTLHPLFTLIQLDRQSGMVRSLLDTYRHTGWLPDARIAGHNGLTQGGSEKEPRSN